MHSQFTSHKPSAHTQYPIPVVILAGGQGSRMGGIDKCLLKVGEHTILERIITNLSRQSTHIFLNANGNPTRFSQYPMTLVQDNLNDTNTAHMDGDGPLAGILAALVYLREHGSHACWLASVAGDCPFLPNDLIGRLHAHCDDNTDVVYCHHNARDHFVIALWSRALEQKLRLFLSSQQRSVGKFIAGLRHQKVTFDTLDIDSFMNINTHAQLEQAQVLAKTLWDT